MENYLTPVFNRTPEKQHLILKEKGEKTKTHFSVASFAAAIGADSDSNDGIIAAPLSLLLPRPHFHFFFHGCFL